MSILISGILIVLLVLLKIGQAVLHQRRLRSIPIRVLVNGTRGKTDVSRLIASGLRRGGIDTMAGTTGVRAEWIDTVGTVHARKRRVPARLDELFRFVRQAHEEKAEAIVVECMALNPFLQEITQKKIVKAQIGVITNIRSDHTNTMGKTGESIARTLSLTIPKGGTLFASEKIHLPILKEEAAKRDCRVVSVEKNDQPVPPGFPGEPIKENIDLALAVCRHLGIDDATALEGMTAYLPDSGAFNIVPFQGRNGTLHFANALAANDPESASKLLERARARCPGNPIVGVFCHRSDRPWRAEAFSQFMEAASFEKVYHTKHFFRLTTLVSQLEDLPEGGLVFAFGNFKGRGEKLLREVEKRCCRK
ncbi:MAG: poly-gamma-glutamate synthase PgsB [Proteobacteria bacterium]|nr:poly-gamma-glutamate synthase PgsB [Pseudomonadota bacterium]